MRSLRIVASWTGLLTILAACASTGTMLTQSDSCAAGDVRPEGGIVVLPGIASVTFPAGAFRALRTVTVCATTSAETRRDFRITAEEVLGARRLFPHEIRINTGEIPPSDAVITMTVPPASVQALPPGHRVRAFVQFWQAGGEETLDGFEAVPSLYDATGGTLSLSLPEGSFTDQRRADRMYEAVVVIGSLPAP